MLPRTPSSRLDGRRALVTGAGRGLGVACAAALAQAGAHVTLAARTSEETAAVAEAIRTEGSDAGTNRPRPFLEVTADDYDAIMGLNVRAAFFVAQAAARRLAGAGRPGSIIHMSSQMGHVGGARRTVYCASKHAIEGLCKAMAVELGPLGIRVNTICPTFIETPLTRPYFEDPVFRADVLDRIKLGRLGQPADLMGAVVFLASDASGLMTGSAVMVDGGWTAE